MGNLNPTIGRIVLFTVNDVQAQVINARRTDSGSIRDRLLDEKWPAGAQAHIGNKVSAGDQFPAMIVRVWPDTEGPTGLPLVNLRVNLDGTDDYWATSVAEDHQPGVPGTWCWPVRP